MELARAIYHLFDRNSLEKEKKILPHDPERSDIKRE